MSGEFQLWMILKHPLLAVSLKFILHLGVVVVCDYSSDFGSLVCLLSLPGFVCMMYLLFLLIQQVGLVGDSFLIFETTFIKMGELCDILTVCVVHKELLVLLLRCKRFTNQFPGSDCY